jgi:hypothetical protein
MQQQQLALPWLGCRAEEGQPGGAQGLLEEGGEPGPSGSRSLALRAACSRVAGALAAGRAGALAQHLHLQQQQGVWQLDVGGAGAGAARGQALGVATQECRHVVVGVSQEAAAEGLEEVVAAS